MTTPPPVSPLVAKKRYEYWQETVCAAYGPSLNRQLSDDPFEGSLEKRLVGGVTFSRIQSMPIEYNRHRAMEDCDDFFLTLTLCNETFVSQQGRDSKQLRGDIALYDGARPYTCSFPDGDDQLVLVIPRPMVLRHIPRANDFLSLTLSTSSALGKLTNSMITEIWSAPTVNPNAEERLNGSLLDVVSTAFETAFPTTDSAIKPHQASQLHRVKEYLLDNLNNHDLTINTISKETFVAPRTLNRLFANEGTTAIRWLWMQRLSACHDALLTGRYTHVTEAALSFGFTNLSHFSHAFKRAYGITPQQLLRS